MGSSNSTLAKIRAMTGGYHGLINHLCCTDNIGLLQDLFNLYPDLVKYYLKNRTKCQFDRYVPYLIPDLFRQEVLQRLDQLPDVERRDVVMTLTKFDFREAWPLFLAAPEGRELLAEHPEWLVEGLAASFNPEPDTLWVQQQQWLWTYLLGKRVLTEAMIRDYLKRNVEHRRFMLDFIVRETDPVVSGVLYRPLAEYLVVLHNDDRLNYLRGFRKRQLEAFIPLLLRDAKQLNDLVLLYLNNLYTRLTPYAWAYMLVLVDASLDYFREVLTMQFIPLDLFRKIMGEVPRVLDEFGERSSCFRERLFEKYQLNTIAAVNCNPSGS